MFTDLKTCYSNELYLASTSSYNNQLMSKSNYTWSTTTPTTGTICRQKLAHNYTFEKKISYITNIPVRSQNKDNNNGFFHPGKQADLIIIMAFFHPGKQPDVIIIMAFFILENHSEYVDFVKHCFAKQPLSCWILRMFSLWTLHHNNSTFLCCKDQSPCTCNFCNQIWLINFHIIIVPIYILLIF